MSWAKKISHCTVKFTTSEENRITYESLFSVFSSETNIGQILQNSPDLIYFIFD